MSVIPDRVQHASMLARARQIVAASCEELPAYRLMVEQRGGPEKVARRLVATALQYARGGR